jgi:anti-sigma regulatory factor (Ser/Thr protein kinase)
MGDFALIVPENFIQATRDSGYKSLGSALAELVDNAFEAKATNVVITIEKCSDGDTPDVRVCVTDNGIGMDRHTLRHALQFGWSSRFNQRDSHGRYGMGLPNASLSHARRVDLISSQDGRTAAATYLDVDEVARGQADSIPQPHQVTWAEFALGAKFTRGTLVTWQKCDRLLDRKLGPLTRKLRAELGRLFRYQLWANKTITVNGEPVVPFDPLFTKPGFNMTGAVPLGPDLLYPVTIPGSARKRTSTVTVRFTQLPVSQWHSLSNEEKNAQGIAKNAGVSIVRAGREIDRGWFFMGNKRKENYDDWWRCEVCFEPDLDEWFGVTHTKQEIHPTENLVAILAPDMERIARDLNGKARRAFTEVKSETQRRKSEAQAEKFDNLIEPPNVGGTTAAYPNGQARKGGRGRVAGLKYCIRFRRLDSEFLYQPELDGTRLTVVLNEAHPFVRQLWPRDSDRSGDGGEAQRSLELLLLAAARSEISLAELGRQGQGMDGFRRTWSSTLATFLS